MTVSLMAYIPDEPVLRGVEDVMAGHTNLYCTEAGGQVTGISAQAAHNKAAQLTANFR